MKNEYKHLLKIHMNGGTVVLKASNDINELEDLKKKCETEWIASILKNNDIEARPELKSYETATLEITTAPEGATYCL